MATATSGVVAVLAALTSRRRTARLAALAWAAATAEFAWSRIVPGPRDADEIRRMLLSSAVIPFAATYHSLRGAWQHRGAGPWRGAPDLVLVDRDGTIVHDVPYNGDPEAVVPVEGAREALDRLRTAGVRVGVVTNQSGVGSGRVSREQVDAVNARVEELLGPFDVWQVCPHAADEGCGCRKPAPGLVKEACHTLGVDPGQCVVIGDIGSDVEAARAAGAEAILVPTEATRDAEIRYAGRVALCLGAAVDELLRAAR